MADLSARIEPFVLLARSTKGAAAAKIIADATSAAGVYTFSELLEVSNIQELSTDPAHAAHYQLLRLFAYGTLTDYDANPTSYPAITPTQLVKLKQLTLVSQALQHRSLSYDQLLPVLKLDTIRELENLIIDVIYAGLLGGKMHHHEKVLHVDWVAGRDVEESDLTKIQEGLANWCKTASTLLSALDAEIDAVRQSSAIEAQRLAAYKQQRDEIYYAIASDPRLNQSPGIPGPGAQGRGGIGGNSKGGKISGDGAFGGFMGRFGANGGGNGGGRMLIRSESNSDGRKARGQKRPRD